MNIFKIASEETFYHGSCTARLPSIKKSGISQTFLADTYDKAQHYAKCSAEDFGGEPIVFKVHVPDKSILKYDRYAMNEPVMADDEARDRAWEKAAEQHPEWVKDDNLIIPDDAWKISWGGVGSVRVDGLIPYKYLERIS